MNNEELNVGDVVTFKKSTKLVRNIGKHWVVYGYSDTGKVIVKKFQNYYYTDEEQLSLQIAANNLMFLLLTVN